QGCSARHAILTDERSGRPPNPEQAPPVGGRGFWWVWPIGVVDAPHIYQCWFGFWLAFGGGWECWFGWFGGSGAVGAGECVAAVVEWECGCGAVVVGECGWL